MIYEQMKLDIIQALRDKNDLKKNLLRTLIGDLDNTLALGSDGKKILPSDKETIAMIKSFIKRNEDTQSKSMGRNESILKSEWAILSSYLPTQLTSDEIREIGKKLLSDAIDNPPGGVPYAKPGFGDAMKHLKENYNGQYDGKLASEVLKSVFNP